MTKIRLKKWTLARRGIQLAVILLMVSPLTGLSIFQGNLASASLLGLKLSDPLAFLQVVLAAGIAIPAFAGSALLVAGFYFLAGGRSFCSWVCPVYLVTELADKVRSRLGSGDRTFDLAWKKWALALTLAVTAVTGIPLFETLSPIGMVNRALLFGSWTGLFLIAGIVVAESIYARRIWCRSLCPLGGFYGLLGRFSPVRVGFRKSGCTGCGNCARACPVEEVLVPSLARGEPLVRSGECTRCGRCVDVCAGRALTMTIGYK
jgi:ferredoxin-type protein NapH